MVDKLKLPIKKISYCPTPLLCISWWMFLINVLHVWFSVDDVNDDHGRKVGM